MQRIVAATDFSTRSQVALRRAGIFARRAGAELTLVHVVEDDQPREFVEVQRREAEKFLGEQMRSLAELRDVRCSAAVTTGEAFEGILRAAQDASADVIVMGTHRKQALRDIFVGTTIERVIRTGPYPVLMVNAAPERLYAYVLAAVDMSEPSARALQAGQALGLFRDRHVTLLHAISVARGMLHGADVPADRIAGYVADERRRARKELSAFVSTHDIDAEGWSYRIEEGTAPKAISRVAKETRQDLVVIGTHGRSGLANMLIGSVAEEVLRSLDVDILAVPPARG